VSLRLANIYDLSSKILLLKFAKPDNKKQLVIDTGFRCHLTEFARTTAAAPSAFVARLRKVLKTRRLTSVAQVGTDRILEFQFSDGQYRLFLEFFAVGSCDAGCGEVVADTNIRAATLSLPMPTLTFLRLHETYQRAMARNLNELDYNTTWTTDKTTMAFRR